MSPDVLHEIDWLLARNLQWALHVERIAKARGIKLADLSPVFPSVRLLLQLRSAELS